MYDFLRGTVAAVDTSGRLSFEVNGVGYSLRVSEQTRRTIPIDGRTVTLFVRLQVKEDDLVLFGFADVAERSAFDLLTGVQMVGPAMALGLLSALGVSQLKAALAGRDVAALKRVKGVGPKSAERIILELADKVDRIPSPQGSSPAPGGNRAVEDANRGLVALGFGAKEAAEALASVQQPGMTAEQLLRAALAVLR